MQFIHLRSDNVQCVYVQYTYKPLEMVEFLNFDIDSMQII